MLVACYIHTSGTCGCSDLVTGCRRLPRFPIFLDAPSALTCNAVFTLPTRCCRHAIANRSLLSSGNTTIFSNGWAQGWGWWASGARNISEVPGVGVNQESGLCTTFPGPGVREPCTLLPCHLLLSVASPSATFATPNEALSPQHREAAPASQLCCRLAKHCLEVCVNKCID